MAKKKSETLPAVTGVKEVEKIDEILTNLPAVGIGSQAVRTLKGTLGVAAAIKSIRDALTPAIMDQIMELKNTPLGFMTDERKATSGGRGVQYSVEQVKDFVVETLANGFMPAGNEVNLIANRMYAAKAGIARKLREVPGLTNLQIDYAVPKGEKGGSVVHFDSTWKINGQDQSLSGDIPIRVNNYMGTDAILGKAERKAKYRILNQVVGSELGFVDGDISDAEEIVIKDAKVDDFAAGRSEIKPKALEEKPDESVEAEVIDIEMPESALDLDETEVMATADQLSEIKQHLGKMKVTDKEMMLSVVNDALKLGDFEPVKSATGLTKVAATFVIDQLMPQQKKTSDSAGPSKAGLF